MALYFLDTEFNGFNGELISLALVREDGESISLVFGCDDPVEWVKDNVMPILFSDPVSKKTKRTEAGREIAAFLKGDKNPTIISDWPEDISQLCGCLITGPGEMVNIRSIAFRIVRVDAYPTDLKGAVQHNAWWDAMALRHLLGSHR